MLSKIDSFWKTYKTAPRLQISLRGAFSSVFFEAFNSRHPKLPLLRRKKWGVAIVDLKSFGTYEAYLESVSGKNSAAYFSRKSAKQGYSVREINPNDFSDKIHEIHHSSSERQGQKISKEYDEKITNYSLEDCIYFGVFNSENKLVGYLWLINTGELIVLNRTMGHASYLKDGVMYLMFTEAIRALFERKISYFMYDMLLGGSDGLRLFKTRLGFKPYVVNWSLDRAKQ